MDIPDDENGNVLLTLMKRGDPLTEPREINFHFIFPTRSQAIGFIEILPDKDLRHEISWYAEYEGWQITVVKHMIPTHQEISDLENRLIDQSQPLGGVPDGWGCFAVKP